MNKYCHAFQKEKLNGLRTSEVRMFYTYCDRHANNYCVHTALKKPAERGAKGEIWL